MRILLIVHILHLAVVAVVVQQTEVALDGQMWQISFDCTINHINTIIVEKMKILILKNENSFPLFLSSCIALTSNTVSNGIVARVRD